MAEIDDLKAMVASLVSKHATLEAELRAKPAPAAKTAQEMPDFETFKELLFLDPIGTMKGMGASPEVIDYTRDVFIADKLGNQAPPKLRMLAQQGPAVIAAKKQETAVAALSRKLDDFISGETNAKTRDKFAQAITQMKDKYPNLVKAHSVDSASIEAELLKHGGSVEDFAAAQEARWSKFGLAPVSEKPVTPAASEQKADQNADLSKKVDPAKPAVEGDNVVWTEQANKNLIASILAKNTPATK